MEQCKREAYEKYFKTASEYTTPLSYDEWCKNLINRVFDIMATC